MAERGPHVDSARQLGLDTTFRNFLIVVDSGITTGEELWPEFLPAEFEAFLLVFQQPEAPWIDGDHSWIQRIS